MPDHIKPWTRLRLKDRIRSGVRVLFVGINPGVRSAETGHHFAGYSNRFWKLLYESGLVPEPITYRDDERLPEWGFGITNLIARPSPGIDDLAPAEYLEGWRVLERKIEKFKPEIVAFVGVTLYRSFCLKAEATSRKGLNCVGVQPQTIHGAWVFVLPNPSGRNANFSYAEMLAAFRRLKRALRERRKTRSHAGRRGAEETGSPRRGARGAEETGSHAGAQRRREKSDV